VLPVFRLSLSKRRLVNWEGFGCGLIDVLLLYMPGGNGGGARGSLLVKALGYRPEGRGFQT
jgi:hypothetical protein